MVAQPADARGCPHDSPADSAMVTCPGKILVLTTMSHPSGAPMAALRLTAALRETGWDCSSLFLYARSRMDEVDAEYRCLIPREPVSIRDYARILIRLFRYVRAERPDVVLAFLPLASVLGSLVGAVCGIQTRIASHRVPVNTYAFVMRQLDLIAAWLGLYTNVVAVSKSVAQSCSRYPSGLKRRISVVYNGLKGWRRSSLSKPEARRKLGLPAEATIVAAVGRMEQQKNYPLLISAMRDVPPQCILAIAGEGILRDELEAQIAAADIGSRVMLLGALPRSEVPHLLAAADLFAQPSLFEGQSNALLEALSADLPCLVSDIPEQVETVTGPDGEIAGAILPLDQPAAWARAIAAFSSCSDLIDAAVAAATRQSQLFSFERMVGEWEVVLSDARHAGRQTAGT